MNHDYRYRFNGIARLYGECALNYFSQQHILVVGIGGVGSWVTEALARNGIGAITLLDLDDICVSNINRQVHALTSTVGRSKNATMQQRLLDINPHMSVTVIDDLLTAQNCQSYIQPAQFDFVVDAIDSVPSKTALIAHCKRNKIPMITLGGAGGKIDPLQIKVADLSKVYQDPLLAKVRQKLKKDYTLSPDSRGRFSIRCVFSSEQLRYPATNGDICYSKPDSGESLRLDCASGFGSTTHVTASMALVGVSDIMRRLAEKSLSLVPKA